MNAYVNGSGGREDGMPGRPYRPVEFRLVGSRASVAAYLRMLERFFSLTGVSEPEPAPDDKVRVYGTMHRPYRLTGGEPL
ncbi:hypothetical protein [Allorhizocola rhizosphaerae]|uniref:hypothetical protein n=1 Tax=Allorhizocola rhizosphaerae TaxID=1872709 RepID=UPI000E3D4830|nr:hypothetical protein [Allorhizocola rhizosphaerae]